MSYRVAIPGEDVETLTRPQRDRLTAAVKAAIDATDGTLTRHDATNRFILVGYDTPPAELVTTLEQLTPGHHLTLGAIP